ncbi:MAG: hypothetical protein KAX49_13065 [Halanaerobiales bacterium]|nr:hypothetical protein [Halanaerobiales bacterium]
MRGSGQIHYVGKCKHCDHWRIFYVIDRIANSYFTCIKCNKKVKVKTKNKLVTDMKIVGPLRPADASLKCAELNGLKFDINFKSVKKKGVEVIK